METRTAYCKKCKRNVPITHFIPKRHLLAIPVFITIAYILDFIVVIMRANTAIITGQDIDPNYMSMGFWDILCPLSFCLLFIPIPSNSSYCEKCGVRIGNKGEEKSRCIYCDTELEPGVVFCPNCGKRYRDSTDSIVCNKCKTENTPESMFCAKCGTKLQEPKERKTKQKTTDANEWSDWE